MIVIKTLTDVLELEVSSTDIFGQNPKEICMRLLKEKYLGKCYMSCFILEVLEVLNSPTRKFTDSNTANAMATVMFKVKAVIFNKNDVIFCKIGRKDADISASHKYSEFKIYNRHMFDPYVTGETVPVIVRTAGYTPGKNKITVVAIPFVPLWEENYVYKITTPASDIEKQYMRDMIEEIENVSKKLQHLAGKSKQGYTFFTKLVYPFHKEQKSPKKIKGLAYGELLNINEGYVYDPIETNHSEWKIYYSKDDPELKLPVKEESMLTVATRCLLKHYKYLQLICDLLETYPTREAAERARLVWKLYNLNKK